MAARLNRHHSDMVPDKIKASQFVNRLKKHASGDVEMNRAQVESAKFLLNKIIPNPPQEKRVEHQGEDLHRPVIIKR